MVSAISVYGNASRGKENIRKNKETRNSINRKRITVSLKYVSTIRE